MASPEFRNESVRSVQTDTAHSIWLNITPEPGGPELDDVEVPIPDEAPTVTELRNSRGGPYYLAPDNTEPVPPNLLAAADTSNVIATAKRGNAQLAAAIKHDGKIALPSDQEKYLKSGGPAARKLLETLNRGLEATTPELDAAVEARLAEAGFSR